MTLRGKYSRWEINTACTLVGRAGAGRAWWLLQLRQAMAECWMVRLAACEGEVRGEQDNEGLTFGQIRDKPHNMRTGRQELLVSLKDGERGEDRAGAGHGARDHTEQQVGQRVTAGAV